MRSAILFIFLILLSSFSAGYFALSFRSLPSSDRIDYSEILQLKNQFTTRHAALWSLETSGAFISPDLRLPKVWAFKWEESSTLYRHAQTCDASEIPHSKVTDPALKKAWLWQRFQCHQLSNLPSDFFETQPAFHPSGSTYLYLAWKSGMPPYHQESWIKDHFRKMHATEWQEVPEKFKSPSETLMGNLSDSALEALKQEAPLIFAEPYLILKTNQKSENQSVRYYVYPLQDFRKALDEKSIRISQKEEGSACIFAEGNACWNFDRHRIDESAMRTFFFSGLTLLLGLIAAVILVQILKRKNEEDRRSQFALQTLTHELRTPVANLVLNSDRLKKAIDHVDEETQDALLGTLEETQRLVRLIEASQNYLSSQSRKLVDLNPTSVASAKEYFEAVVSEHPPAVLSGPTADFSMKQDLYWLSLCLNNILKNALAHGQPEVKLEYALEGTWIKIQISDQGECQFSSISELTEPFLKGKKSKGLGLGLTLVSKIVAEMGGKLEFSNHPTTFTFTLPQEIT